MRRVGWNGFRKAAMMSSVRSYRVMKIALKCEVIGCARPNHGLKSVVAYAAPVRIGCARLNHGLKSVVACVSPVRTWGRG
jgi:hypothetical protein